MRLSATSLVVVSLLLASCRSTSGPEEVLAIKPSNEVTSAISASAAPIPAAEVAADAGAPQADVPEQHALAWAGQIPQTQALTSATTTVAMPLPAEKPVAMLVPENPAATLEPQVRSRIYSHRFRDAKPINFGKSSPKKYAVHGVDVSRWQGDIDWMKLRTQGANFAYIKATDGGDHLDPMFKTNWRRAKDAGLKRGAYHFFYWCRTAGEQAEWFIRNVPRDPDALPPVIDVEYNAESSCKRRLSTAKIHEKMQVFMDMLERHYGKRPIIYTAPDFYDDHLEGAFREYPFWLRSVAAHPSKVYPGRKWLFWQYSGSGLSHGVQGRIDLNVFRGSEEDWHDWTAARAS
ncbi:GH25 family lysozyme [Ciceribacter azotifigens]|uniref:glycoside hydrolase family 25 protein n=1 Tax=Ciceribacter azotifigens TaxID=2069303 RepID=UPI003A8410F5